MASNGTEFSHPSEVMKKGWRIPGVECAVASLTAEGFRGCYFEINQMHVAERPSKYMNTNKTNACKRGIVLNTLYKCHINSEKVEINHDYR